MSKSQDTSRKIPKLRFREFQGEWTTEIMRKLTTLITNGFVWKATDHYVEENWVLYIQGYNVHETWFDFHGIKFVSSEFHLKNKKSILREWDLLTIQTGDVGVTGYVTSELTWSNCHALIISRYKDGMAHSKFYHQYFNSHIWRGVLKTIETWSTMKHLNCGDMEKLNLPYTSFEEQQKIASFLTTVDEKIEKLKTRKSLFEKYKKWVMQKIFSREIRFRDENGEEFGEWEEKSIAEIISSWYLAMKNNLRKPISAEERAKIKWQYPYYWAANIIDYLNSYQIEWLHLLMAEDWTVTSNWKNPTLQLVDGYFNVSNHAHIFKGNNEITTRFFYFELLNTNISAFITWAVQPKLNKESLLKIQLSIPPNYEERQKIASFLSEIDKKIDTINSEIESTEKWKKGLLQQMFI